MSIREIDPADADARRIDHVMQDWRREEGTSFEQDLRRRLGGPVEAPMPESPPADQPVVLEPPAVVQPRMPLPPAIEPPRPEMARFEPPRREAPPRPTTITEESESPSSSRAAPRPTPVRHATPRRRNTKQWKKGSKARRR